MPDHIHTPNGILPVQAVVVRPDDDRDILDHYVKDGQLVVTLNTNATAAGAGVEWAYYQFTNPVFRLSFPEPGSYVVRGVTRSDGTLVPEANAWVTTITERTTSGSGRRLLQTVTTKATLHILDSGSFDNYTTNFAPDSNCTCFPTVECLPNATGVGFVCGPCPAGASLSRGFCLRT